MSRHTPCPPAEHTPHGGPLHTLHLPSAEQPWRYALRYGRSVCARLLGQHRLQAAPAQAFVAEVAVGDTLRLRWQRLFGAHAGTHAGATLPPPGLPYLHAQSVGILLYDRLFAELGLNMRHVMHVAHHTVHHAGVAACAAARRQRLVCSLRRTLRLAEDKALIELQTQLLDADGTLLAVVSDSFLARRLPPADLQALPSDIRVMRDLLGLRQRPARLRSRDPGTQVRALPLPPRLGLDYGLASGDLGPVHAGRLGARLYGARQPFVPGMGLRHLLLHPLAALNVPLERLSLTFASPAYLGHTLTLLVQGARFELQDMNRRVVAFGSGGHHLPLAAGPLGSPVTQRANQAL